MVKLRIIAHVILGGKAKRDINFDYRQILTK